MKTSTLVKFVISTPVKFIDREDLDQQIEYLLLELEALGFEIETSKYKLDEDDDSSFEEIEEKLYDEEV